MRRWVVGVALIAVVVLGALFWMGYTLEEGASGNLGITFYDAEGNPVDLTLAYMRGGEAVTQLGVEITWSYTGKDLVIGTLETWGTLKIDLLEQTPEMRVKMSLLSEPWVGEPRMYNSWSSMYELSNLLPSEFEAEGWLIRVSTTLFASIYDDFGNKLEDNIPLSSDEFMIGWEAQTGTFSIGGSITA